MTASGSLHTAARRRLGATCRDRLRARGLRWTPQRRTLIEVLSKTDGHVTGVGARRALPGDRPRDDPLDRLPDARRPRGARPAEPQPRRRRPRGVPRPAGGRPRPPPLHRLRDDVGDRGRRSRGPRLDARACGATSRSTSAISRSPAAAARVARPSMADGGDGSAAPDVSRRTGRP